MDLWKHLISWCKRPNMIKTSEYNPQIVMMSKLGRGVKVGATSGVIYGPLNWLIINMGLNLPYGHLGNWISRIMTDGTWYLGCITINLVSGLIFGLIFGLLFAALYDKLPGKTSTMKGIMISIIYWFTIPLGLPVLANLYRWGLEGLYWFSWQPTLIGLGTSIIWGWLLGRFWASERLGKL